MVKISIDIPDPKVAAIIDAFCERHGYEGEVMADDGTMVPNPQAKPAFFKERVIACIQSSARHAMVAAAAKSAEASVKTKIDEDTSW